MSDVRQRAVCAYAEECRGENAFRLCARLATMLVGALTVGAGLFLATGEQVWFPVTMVVALPVSMWWERHLEIGRDVSSLQRDIGPMDRPYGV